MTQNQKSFRKVLIVLAFIGIFLLGTIIEIKLSTTLLLSLLTFAIGLLLGYAIGAEKNLRFWEKNNKKK